jgi:hypothetical protein
MDSYNRWNTSNSAAGGSSLDAPQQSMINDSSTSGWTIADINQRMLNFEIDCIDASLEKATEMNKKKDERQRNLEKKTLREARDAWIKCSQSFYKKDSNTVELYIYALNLTDEANIKFAIDMIEFEKAKSLLMEQRATGSLPQKKTHRGRGNGSYGIFSKL